jgi:hypothetical protein
VHETELLILGLCVAIPTLSVIARLLDIPYPIVLVLGAIPLGYLPGVPLDAWYMNILGPVVLLAKMMLVAFLLFWLRFSAPRFREDQLQELAWKFLIPLSLAWILLLATIRIAEEQSQLRVLEERTRIARELPDVVAHHMSVIAVQASTAPYRITAERPAEVDQEFRSIGASARESLQELRQVLEVLRGATLPRPALADLPKLVESFQSSPSL